MKKIFLILLVFILVSLVLFFADFFKGPKTPADFIKRYFVLDNGAVLAESMDRGTVLSESCGLYLLGCVQLGDRASFDRTFDFIKNGLVSENGLLFWKINLKTGEKDRSSASIDDLRVVRALILAHKRWKDPRYLDEALGLAMAVKEKETKDGFLTDSFSWYKDEHASDIVNISYLDLFTMKQLSDYDPDWGLVYQKCMDLLLRSTKESGLFFEEYNLENKKFSYTDGNMINQLYSALHLAEIGLPEEKIQFVSFLRKSARASGTVFISYKPGGAPKEEQESAAVYALCARLMHALNGDGDEKKFLKNMLSFQEKFRYNKYYGGFGWFFPFEKKRNYNSFDSLEALLTITEE